MPADRPLAQSRHKSEPQSQALIQRAARQGRAQSIQAGVVSMQQERIALEQSTAELNGKATALDRWLSANEAKNSGGAP